MTKIHRKKQMRFYEKISRFIALGMILTIGFGCKFFQLKELIETAEEPPKTRITKEILTQRLTARLVKTAAETRGDKPNPLTLQIKFSTGSDNFLLNGESKKSFGELANTLREIFRERENNGIFIEGTNEVYKKITLPAYQELIDEYNSKNITVEDFEKLVDALRNENLGQIEFDPNESSFGVVPNAPKLDSLETRRKLSNVESNEPQNSGGIKTISGGVLNAKAVELPKPVYPPAAKAVRASGAVNVQVTVDEKGDVVSASAVSGHPLLRTTAEIAARQAKFAPTLLSGKAVRVSGIIVYNFAPE